MGCISSSNKQLFSIKSDNVFNVSVIRVQSEQSVVLAEQGQLEVTPNEVIFVAANHERVSWPLQHLRRYGLTDNIFSFEAGRRCATGPGIYTFRCCNADQLYTKFQLYINLMSAGGERDRFINSTHPSLLFERVDAHQQQNANHYLEPSSLMVATVDHAPVLDTQLLNGNNGSNLNSPDSVTIPSLTAEVVHIPSTLSYSNINPNNSNYNIYMDQPMPTSSENNNNTSVTGIGDTVHSGSVAYKTMVKSSFDAPPDECAPVLSPAAVESQRMYSNVDSLAHMQNTTRPQVISTGTENYEPAYVNIDINNSALSYLAHNLSQSNSSPEKVNNAPSNAVVNYIVLDLDQPRSPSQSSPKAAFGSGQSLSGSRGNLDLFNVEESMSDALSLPCGSSTIPKRTTMSDSRSKLWNPKIESSGSYTRIDFLKTFALMKSSTNYADFDPDPEQEECRITRHSKFVRKSYSISE